jgi:hypothetical protein
MREPDEGRSADGGDFTRDVTWDATNDTVNAACRYAELGWRVEVGHGLVDGTGNTNGAGSADGRGDTDCTGSTGSAVRTGNGGGAVCGCGDSDCPLPGAHPLNQGWWTRATADVAEVRARWSRHPGAGVLLALGGGVAAVEVPALIGVTVLEHLSRRAVLGPVIDGLRRMWFLAAAGSDDDADIAVLTEWRHRGLELWPRGIGEFVPLPPTNRGCRHELVWTASPHVRYANDHPAVELPGLERVVASVVTAIRDARPDLWYGDAADTDPVPAPSTPNVHHAA